MPEANENSEPQSLAMQHAEHLGGLRRLAGNGEFAPVGSPDPILRAASLIPFEHARVELKPDRLADGAQRSLRTSDQIVVCDDDGRAPSRLQRGNQLQLALQPRVLYNVRDTPSLRSLAVWLVDRLNV